MIPTERQSSIDALATTIMLMLTFTWGLNQVLMKVANDGFSPVFATTARSTLAALFILVWCRWKGITLFDRDGTFWPGVVVGLLFGSEFALIFIGLDYTTAARGVLVLYTMPFWILIGAHVFLDEKLTAPKIAGLALAFAGVALVFSDQLSMPNPDAVFGDVLLLAGAILWAATTIVIRRTALATAEPEKTLLYQLVVSAIMTALMIPFFGSAVRNPTAIPVTSLLIQAFFVVGVTYLTWFRMIRIYPAAGLSSFAFLTPVFGVILGGLLLDEPLSWRMFGALGMVAAGLFVVNRNWNRKLVSAP